MDDSNKTGFARWIGDAVIDLCGVGGAGLVIAGAEMIYRPAGFIVAGCFLLTGAWLAARKAG